MYLASIEGLAEKRIAAAHRSKRVPASFRGACPAQAAGRNCVFLVLGGAFGNSVIAGRSFETFP
jgi:hypothetical protein